jgi:hypothetical protein
MRNGGQGLDGIERLASVLPVLAIGLGRAAVHLARGESRMIRETLEGIMWGPERNGCCCQPRTEWHIRCEPPCYGCRFHG